MFTKYYKMHIIILTVLTTPISSLLDEANLGEYFFYKISEMTE